MVRGVGAAGKSSVIKAMQGLDFDAHQRSTVGASVADVELDQQALQLGGVGRALTEYKSEESEYSLALAAHAASIVDRKEELDPQPTESMLDTIQVAPAPAMSEPMAAAPAAPAASEADRPPSGPIVLLDGAAPSTATIADAAARNVPTRAKTDEPSTNDASAPATLQAPVPLTTAGTAPAPATVVLEAPAPPPTTGTVPAPASPSRSTKASSTTELGAEKRADAAQFPTVTKRATKVRRREYEAPPPVSPELVHLFRKGERQRNLVLKVQDTGGQPVFLSILELLTTPGGTVYLVVFNLVKLYEVRK